MLEGIAGIGNAVLFLKIRKEDLEVNAIQRCSECLQTAAPSPLMPVGLQALSRLPPSLR
jgi:hypothetical protein